jgi:hypothetical protein
MLIVICISTLLIFLVGLFLLRHKHVGKDKQLNGPKGWPVIGNLFAMNPLTVHLKLTEWSQTFGEMFAVTILNNTWVVLNSSAVIREALLTKPYDTIFASKPSTFAGEYMMHKHADIIFAPYSPEFVKRRKLVHKFLKMSGESR